MTYNQLILKVILYNYRKYFAYFFCVTFSMTVFFLFTAIWFVPDFTEQASAGTRQIVQIAGVISCVFSVIIITYAYQQFYKKRTKEIGILMSYGLLYRDLKRMIIFENSFIFMVAILIALLTGSVFSRLFFMITTSILGIDNIHFALTFNSFLLTSVSFIPIYLLIVVLTMIKMKKYRVTKLIKANRVNEMKRGGSILLALLGIGIIVSSLTFLYVYTSDFSNVNTMRQVILLTLLCMVVGVYLLLSHFISIFYVLWKQRTSFFYKNILSMSDFASKFTQNRSVIFLVCLLSIGVVFFSTLAYTLYHQSYQLADNEQQFDIIMKDYSSIQLDDYVNIEQIVDESSSRITKRHELSVVYLEAPEMHHTPWRTNKTVMATSTEELNNILTTQFEVEEGNALVIDFNQSRHESIDYFGETILLNTEHNVYSFINQGIELQKIFDRYVFAQPVLILLSEAEFNSISKNANQYEVGSIHLFKFDDWLDSGVFVAKLNKQMDAALVEIAESKDGAIEVIKNQYHLPFIVHSKYDRFVNVKQVAGFALFIMSFISLLFIVTVCVVLYFKTFADQEDDQQKIYLLRTIGITTNEIKVYLNKKLIMVMALPVVIGSVIGLFLSVAINLYNVAELEILNKMIFFNGLKVTSLYVLFIGLYYFWLKIGYRKAVE